MRLLHNPVMPGFYPDPSVCRAGEDYYMVNSTFEYFPGVPVFHSRDLVNWRQIGHCLDRPSQLPLDGLRPSKGIYAPTIRYHGGLFYMVTTLVTNDSSERINFFVTAKDPAGPWSEPIIVKDAPGIDPTIFFDDDGKAYFLGKRREDVNDRANPVRLIWLQELDLATGELKGEMYILRSDGALHGATKPEGPHLYKRGGWYYLLIAEGGTGFEHAVTVFRSRQLAGPYEVSQRNPVMTHRMMSRASCKITGTGHADLVELGNGEWWSVLLACRPYGGSYCNLGRETFACPVIWEDDWPVFSPETGRVEFSFPAPELEECRWEKPSPRDDFDSAALAFCWNHLRTPRKDYHSLTERPGWLSLRLMPERLSELANPAFLGRRQQHQSFEASAKMDFTPKTEAETAGLTILYNNDYHIRFEVALHEGKPEARVVKRENGVESVLGRASVSGGELWLRITAIQQTLRFDLSVNGSDWLTVAAGADARMLNSDTAGGFTGVYLGLFASANGTESENRADFDWFEYIPY